MEWLSPMQGKIVGLDTAPLIYFIEENSTYFPMVQPFFQAASAGEFTVVTSVVTLLEVLVHPLRLGNQLVAQRYRDILVNSRGFTMASLVPEIAEKAARFRANYNIKTPDSIQLATAQHYQATFFLTNDMRLPSLPNIKIVCLEGIL